MFVCSRFGRYSIAAKECTWRTIQPIVENMTSSTKPLIHNISQRRQRRTEPRPRATCVRNKLVKFDRAVSEICEWTDRQTYSSQYFAPLPGAKQQIANAVANCVQGKLRQHAGTECCPCLALWECSSAAAAINEETPNSANKFQRDHGPLNEDDKETWSVVEVRNWQSN